MKLTKDQLLIFEKQYKFLLTCDRSDGAYFGLFPFGENCESFGVLHDKEEGIFEIYPDGCYWGFQGHVSSKAELKKVILAYFIDPEDIADYLK